MVQVVWQGYGLHALLGASLDGFVLNLFVALHSFCRYGMEQISYLVESPAAGGICLEPCAAVSLPGVAEGLYDLWLGIGRFHLGLRVVALSRLSFVVPVRRDGHALLLPRLYI